jgi:hypothetical protein
MKCLKGDVLKGRLSYKRGIDGSVVADMQDIPCTLQEALTLLGSVKGIVLLKDSSQLIPYTASLRFHMELKCRY